MVIKLLGGPKTINVLSDHIVKNQTERTDRHPMFVVRYAGVAHFAQTIEATGPGELRAVSSCFRPMPKVDPFGVGHGTVVAWIETDAPLTLWVDDHERCEILLPADAYCGGGQN